MSSSLTKTAAQAFMDKLVGDWAIAGVFRDQAGDGSIIGESSFIQPGSVGGRTRENSTLVYIPTQKGRGYEDTVEAYLSNSGSGIAYSRSQDRITDEAGLSFLTPTSLQGIVIYQPGGVSRRFKIATRPDASDYFEMLVETVGTNGVRQDMQHLRYKRAIYGPVQK